MQVLEDDKDFFVPYDIAFIIRDDVKEMYPELMEIIDSLAGKLTYEDMIKMNAAVDEKGRSLAGRLNCKCCYLVAPKSF